MLVVGCGLLVAGCGSSSNSSNAATSASSGTASAAGSPKCGSASGKPATGAPIPVGAMVTATGGSDISGGGSGAQAYFKCLNANGGINGRPVSYTVVDDGLQPAKVARGAAELLQDKKVVAIIGSSSYLECAIAGPIYAKAGVFEIESGGAAAQCYTSPNVTSDAMGAVTTNIGTVQYAVEELGAKKIALLTPDVPGLGQAVAAGVKRYAQSVGAQLVSVVYYKPGVRDATSLLLTATGKNPDFVEVSAVPQDATTIFKAAQAQDMKSRFKWGCPSPCHAPDFAKSVGSYWDNAISVGMPFADFNAKTPDNQLWQQVMDKFASGVTKDQFSQEGFLAAKIFADTLSKMKGPITRASVGKAIQGIRGYSSDMMCGPFYWGQGPAHVPNHSTRTATVSGGDFKQIKGCTQVKDPQLAPILKQEGDQ
jgi:branched-chain amino acid transport system substrate-binding protein